MLFGLSTLDYLVLSAYLCASLLIGLICRHRQRNSAEYFFAGRSFHGFPLGLSLTATLLSAAGYLNGPRWGYEVGLHSLLLPLSVWLVFPLILLVVLPLYRRLEVRSIYEYLEHRFDARVRFAAAVIFILGRLFWLAAAIYLPCQALGAASGLQIPLPVLLLILGAVSTTYTYWGGMRAVIWTDVMQAAIMFLGLLVVLGGILANLDGGTDRVWRIGESLGRTELVEFEWKSEWWVWAFTPHFALAMISFYAVDQMTAQRFLTARDLPAARRSLLWNCLSLSLMMTLLMYVGLALLAHYHDHPEDLRAKWVVNVDPETRQFRTYGDVERKSEPAEPAANHPPADHSMGSQPLIDWRRDRVDALTFPRLVEERRILRPNSRSAIASPSEFIDADSGRVLVEKLVMRRPGTNEVVLHRQAVNEMLPKYLADHLRFGTAGLVLAAMLAASMSSVDSGLNSLSTLAITDFYQARGWGQRWLARRRKKEVSQLDDEDALYLGQWLVLTIGLGATAASLLVAQINDLYSLVLNVVSTLGGPLTAVFLLGVFTRRCTAQAAWLALLISLVATSSFCLVCQYSPGTWPFSPRLADVCLLPLSVFLTVCLGGLLSFAVGRGKSKGELRGLVAGIGRLGLRAPDEASIEIPDFGETPDDPSRWR